MAFVLRVWPVVSSSAALGDEVVIIYGHPEGLLFISLFLKSRKVSLQSEIK